MRTLILSLLFLPACVVSQAQVIRVPADFPSIQQAIDAAVNGDTVLVSPGTYHENINYNGKAITVGSLYLTNQDTSFITQTIIDGDSISSVATFADGGDTTSVLCGFTLTNGFNFAGGGILIENSNPVISHCIISGNQSTDHGGGIYCSNSSAILENLAIRNNSCVGNGTVNGYGGGGCFSNSPVRIRKSVITGNTASSGGGFCIRTSELLMDSVTLEGNTAFNGGGLYCSGWPVIRNSIIIGNTANKGGGIYFSGGVPKLKKVTIKGNHATEGGGLYMSEVPAYPAFDHYNRCNIYLNTAVLGNDVAASNISRQVQVLVDTFSVLRPTNIYANPVWRFTFNIKHGMITQVMSDVYISPSGNDGNDGLTPETPWRTIRHAGSRIFADDLHKRTIRLLDGRYSPSSTGEEFPVVLPDHTSLVGTSENLVILDAEGSAEVIRMQYNPVPMISGLTITGGSAGGIVCKNSSPLLKNLVIKNNENDWGGGLYIESSHPEIEHVRIENNRATGGGGMSLTWAGAGLRNVIMQGNSGYGSCVNSFRSDLFMINTTLSGNTADSGGAVICNAGSKVKLINSLLWNGPDPEIVILPYRQGYSRDSVSIRYTGLRGGLSGIVTHDTMGVVGWLEGNLDQDPMFSGEGKDPLSLKAGSPCIDVGTPDTAGLALPVIDVAGNPRIFHERIDIGAYEWNNVSIDEERFSIDEWKVRVFPDPFSTSVTFAFSIRSRCTVIVEVYNGMGRRVAEIRRAYSGTGEQTVTWDAAPVPSGIYCYRLSAGKDARTGKLVKQ